MRPADLTPVEIADQLHAAYQEDRRLAPAGPDEEERLALADYLGCHEEARAEAWEAWHTVLELEGHDVGDAEYWLDVEFVEPCPE
ncbi:hypothetical protein [Deinococcus hopiensis]|uniref:Uncharacterized protein n=1 Tax=Deinococcus hopiensis KR-140 TaxID=695939 RepID=A0A1W1VDS7_9DEIO|nr:hypothetical protein [Deinococcus hopiensis]SMB91201.1 hypothetical protein SAMN00790413_01037 [Deinococcus hopiensis KR-140]